jgi:DNA-binding transcriptional ArsR family regulator
MVKYQEETLDRTFAALSDPTRRALLARLGSRESLSVSELAQPFAMSLPAIMKHLDVLSDAGLIAREKTGRTVACRLTAEPMEQAMDWLNRYRRFWSDALDRLAAFVEEDPWPPSQALPSQALPSQALPSTTPPAPPSPPPGRASRSRAGSARRPKKSTPRGPTRKS